MFDQTKQRNKRQVVFKKQVQGHVGRAVGIQFTIRASLARIILDSRSVIQNQSVALDIEIVLAGHEPFC
jgi:hypothetical protein